MAAGQSVIDVEAGIVRNAAEIIARASFGLDDGDEAGARVFRKLQAMQAMLFRSNRLVGVPLARLLQVRKTYEAWKLGREIDALLMEMIDARMSRQGGSSKKQEDLLSLLLAGTGSGSKVMSMTRREVVDE